MPAPKASSQSIIAVAGRRIDSSDAQPARFPFVKVHGVRAAFARKCCSDAARFVGSVRFRSARSRRRVRTTHSDPDHPTVRACIPRDVCRRQTKPGGLYNRLIAEARERGDLIILNFDRDDPSAYAAANQAIIDEALRAAHEGGTAASAHSRGRVWEGAARNGDDATDHFRRI
jgi:hypothetical protein